MAECIYCRARTDAVRFGRPEHVIPKAFGRFESNLTVFCVCEECNQWFGDHLEVSFSRNSAEGLMRLLSGTKPSAEASDIGGNRLTIKAGQGVPFVGGKTHFTEHSDGRTVVATYFAQVGFRATEESEPKWFSETELTSEIIEQYASCDCIVIGHSEEDFELLTRKLDQLGFTGESILWCRPDTSLPLVLEPIEVDYRLDDGVFRTVAKIAFNYLAYTAEASFCLAPDFDALRRFIRYGDGEWRLFVRFDTERLLLDERRFGVRQTRGHLLILEWPKTAKGPFASVKLFNDIHYRIRFTPTTSLLWRDIRSGHHFDLKSHTIQPITIVELRA
jgi:hypothetical protein